MPVAQAGAGARALALIASVLAAVLGPPGSVLLGSRGCGRRGA